MLTGYRKQEKKERQKKKEFKQTQLTQTTNKSKEKCAHTNREFKKTKTGTLVCHLKRD